jgi:peptidylprolyl isomerase/peptidyl-prolyl cis-trans isomerase B (cyclophilin B)
VLPHFMAQGGDPKGNGSGGPGYTIYDEVDKPNYRRHFRGSLSMAKTDFPDTGGSQFFLCFTPRESLDGKHTVFGRVLEGIDVLARIQRIDPMKKEGEPTVIEKAEVLRKREHKYLPRKVE